MKTTANSLISPTDTHKIKLTPAVSEDFECLSEMRVAAMRESLKRMGRFNPDRARERLRNTFSPEHTRIIVVADVPVEIIKEAHQTTEPKSAARGILAPKRSA